MQICSAPLLGHYLISLKLTDGRISLLTFHYITREKDFLSTFILVGLMHLLQKNNVLIKSLSQVNNAGVSGSIFDADALRVSGIGKVCSWFLLS